MKRASSLCLLASSVGAFASFFFAASPAEAFDFGTPKTLHPYRSAQNFALEIRVSPYRPAVDDEPGLNGTPYADRFGTSRRVFVGLEFDWQTFRIPYIGTIGPGLGIGTVSMSRRATTLSGRETDDEYSLSIKPIYLVGVLRIDAPWRDLGFPLVPYLKGGLAVAFWNASNSLGTSESAGVSGKGTTWGTNVAGGVAFPLDAIDRTASRTMDSATGINNTYIYAEYYWLHLNGLAQDRALYVGTNSWAAGLAFEF